MGCATGPTAHGDRGIHAPTRRKNALRASQICVTVAQKMRHVSHKHLWQRTTRCRPRCFFRSLRGHGQLGIRAAHLQRERSSRIAKQFLVVIGVDRCGHAIPNKDPSKRHRKGFRPVVGLRRVLVTDPGTAAIIPVTMARLD
jgi:hypothetical protein